ncbi:hypothetical protein CMO96_02990 [Candidatus Woesebacteria bacterium]|nr:hypothetical protein [Candidatus Woesebacteria bacterium]|tara:strand:- start:965 stop:1396 length:432 start_codon:yes stop_codon:yes gene_type:complete
MANIKTSPVVLAVALLAIVVVTVATAAAGYWYGIKQIELKYINGAETSWEPFLKDKHFKLGISGKLVENDGDLWTVENEGEKVPLRLLPDQIAIKGDSFSAAAMESWENFDATQIAVGEEVLVNAFYHPSDGYIVTNIFVKNK